MAAKELIILQAINAKLEEQTLDGAYLECVRQFFVDTTGEEDFPIEIALPFLYVYAGAGDGKESSIPVCMTRKEFPVVFQAFTGQGSEQHDLSAAQIIDKVETVFYQNNLGISDPSLLINYTNKSYNTPFDVPFSEWVRGAASLTYMYRYTDTRTLPT